MKWIIKLLQNKITIIIVAISMISCFVAIRYQLRIQHNMMLFGLIISFPLVFALQSAFKRRDRVLEFISLFSASLISVSEAFQQNRKMSRSNKEIIQAIIVSLQDNLYNYLRSGEGDPVQILCSFNQVSSFIILNHTEIDDRLKFRIGRYMKDTYDSAQTLVAIKTHGTMVGTRVLSYVFICIFPIIQAQFLLESVGHTLSAWSIYIVSFFTSVTLAALLLIQQELEDPFNQDGLDDIQFDKFTIVGKV